MSDGEHVTLTPAQMRQGVYLLVVTVLLLVVCGRALRVEDPVQPFAVPASGAATAPGRAGPGNPAGDSTEAKRAAEFLLGGEGWLTRDFNPLNKSLGEPVLLRRGETELRVTPARVTAGTAACATGPLVTVDLEVERKSGLAGLSPNNFALVASDGSAAAPIQGCSTGFAEAAARRTLVFAVERPDRLMIGTDPAAPVAAWQLS